jgi:hypothetical protein
MANLFDYLSRSAEQIEQELLTVIPSELPEITDLEGDVFVRGLKVYAGLFELLHYYIDNAAQESNVESARLFSSLVLLARSDDYRVRSRKPFQAVITFTLSAPAPSAVLIPKGTVLETESGLIYTTVLDTTIAIGQTQAIVTAFQEQLFVNQNIGTTSGLASQVLLLSEKLVDGSVILTIGAQQYTPVETYYFSLPADTHFIQSVNPDGLNEIVLGDSVNGKLPTANQTILANYALTEGEAGKALADEIDTIVSVISLPSGFTLSCTNLLDASGGKDRDSTTDIKKNVKALNRTVETAISRETYKSLGELIQGVAKVGLKYEFGNTVDIFVIPDGGGIASPALLAQVEAYYSDKIIICTKVRASSAGEVRVLLTFEVELKPNAVRLQVEQDINNALTTFGSLENQEIGGKMVSGTLNQLVCNITGVETCVLQVFSLKPYARPLGSTTANLNWNVEMLSGAIVQNTWRIFFTTVSSFQLFKDDVFLGNFNVNVQVVQPEVRFTILQNFTSGDQWTFTTYSYLGDRSGTYQLDEPAILRIFEADTTLNLQGGV